MNAKKTNQQKLQELVSLHNVTETDYKKVLKLLSSEDNGLNSTYSKWLISKMTHDLDYSLEQAANERMRVFNEKERMQPITDYVNKLSETFALTCTVTVRNGHTFSRTLGLMCATKSRKAAEEFAMGHYYLSDCRIELRSLQLNENLEYDSEGRQRWVGMDWVNGDAAKRRALDIQYTRIESLKRSERNARANKRAEMLRLY